MHDVLAGTEKSIEHHEWKDGKPSRDELKHAWMLVAHLKVKLDVTPEPALREFMATTYTEQFNKENRPLGMKSKYFTYNADMEVCSGFYVFLNKADLTAYMNSDKWTSQADAPNVASVSFSTHEVLPGTERALDLGEWGGK